MIMLALKKNLKKISGSLIGIDLRLTKQQMAAYTTGL